MKNTPNPNKQKMIDLRGQGLSYGSIAKLVGVSRSRVHQICSGYQNPYISGKNIINRFSVPEYISKIHNLHNSILVRDNFICQWGNLCKGRTVDIKDLVVHHIDFDDRNNSSNNLITLCRSCHSSFHRMNHIDDKILSNLKPKRKYKKCFICKKLYYGHRKTCSNKCLKQIYPNCVSHGKKICT